MAKGKIRTIIFDIGRVLVRLNLSRGEDRPGQRACAQSRRIMVGHREGSTLARLARRPDVGARLVSESDISAGHCYGLCAVQRSVEQRAGSRADPSKQSV